ncbi:hypothetical protein NDU88_009328 [Pleurodeles waltl]|uniref:Uncharacterized protein n=1 Tax=Pleurodeles waltl TaxID=8319 RepID=A0AAV7PZ55_PLEWA|nr:hypothetical protein NDU88_009328 [Pleurodeles waltl]
MLQLDWGLWVNPKHEELSGPQGGLPRHRGTGDGLTGPGQAEQVTQDCLRPQEQALPKVKTYNTPERRPESLIVTQKAPYV